jgi:hypothetical protein
VTQIEALAEKPASANKPLRVKRMGLLDRPFYFCMSLLIGVVVIYGFSRTVGPKLIHPPSPAYICVEEFRSCSNHCQAKNRAK